METVELEKIVEPIVKWYKENKRMLPWRKQKNPYAIWISEIMLQQTRIEAVKVYYERFMREIPNIETLANIEEEVLLKLWEGFGYYSRAKNLKKAAIKICEEYGGNMPKYYEQLVDLPGIGEYTAGAIASIAYHERVPAVDGNVLRVISRIIGSTKDILLPDTKREMTAKLKAIMPKEAGDFNEGLMELGERVCIPNGEPFCNNCPLQAYCVAYKQGLTNQIPVRIKKTKRKYEERLIFVLEWKDKIAIQKRGEKGLLAGMYEFPNVMEKEGLIIKQILQTWNLEAEQKEALGKAKHIFSHIEWNMEGWRIKVKNKNEEIIEKYAIPEAFGYYKNKL